MLVFVGPLLCGDEGIIAECYMYATCFRLCRQSLTRPWEFVQSNPAIHLMRGIAAWDRARFATNSFSFSAVRQPGQQVVEKSLLIRIQPSQRLGRAFDLDG